MEVKEASVEYLPQQESSCPPGYKQTEVGVIPEDWGVYILGNIASIGSGGTPNRQVSEFWGGNIPWLTTTQIDFNVVDAANEFITECGLRNSSAKIYEPGVLLMAMYGQGKTRGKVAILGISATINQACAAISINDSISKKFIFYNLASRYREIRDLSNTGNQENLNSQIIKTIQIAAPPTKAEQEAIATALSDTDALIESLEQLIAKKRHIKQGAMQELLTGKRRLPGFSGEWQAKKLGDIAHIKTGSRNNQDKIEEGEYPFFVRSATVERIDSYSYDCEAILVPGEGGIGSIYHYIEGRFDVHQRVYAITDFIEGVSGKYVYLYMKEHFGVHALQNTVKATVDSLRLPTFEEFEIRLPPTEIEQTEIATIIFNMDTEITALETRLAKTRQLKQGMMHELLTGRIRLT